jgi:hypothetical protein
MDDKQFLSLYSLEKTLLIFLLIMLVSFVIIITYTVARNETEVEQLGINQNIIEQNHVLNLQTQTHLHELQKQIEQMSYQIDKWNNIKTEKLPKK